MRVVPLILVALLPMGVAAREKPKPEAKSPIQTKTQSDPRVNRVRQLRTSLIDACTLAAKRTNSGEWYHPPAFQGLCDKEWVPRTP